MHSNLIDRIGSLNLAGTNISTATPPYYCGTALKTSRYNQKIHMPADFNKPGFYFVIAEGDYAERTRTKDTESHER